MEADAQLNVKVLYDVLQEPNDPMHPVNRLIKGLIPKLDLPAMFTLRDPQSGDIFDIEFKEVDATYEDGSFAVLGTLTSGAKVDGQLNLTADDNGVIGTFTLSITA